VPRHALLSWKIFEAKLDGPVGYENSLTEGAAFFSVCCEGGVFATALLRRFERER
jgi:hypothetical protein